MSTPANAQITLGTLDPDQRAAVTAPRGPV